MTSSIGAVSNVTAQLQTAGASDRDKDDKTTATAGAAAPKGNDHDGDDRAGAAATIDRASASVQQALSNLKTGG